MQITAVTMQFPAGILLINSLHSLHRYYAVSFVISKFESNENKSSCRVNIMYLTNFRQAPSALYSQVLNCLKVFQAVKKVSIDSETLCMYGQQVYQVKSRMTRWRFTYQHIVNTYTVPRIPCVIVGSIV